MTTPPALLLRRVRRRVLLHRRALAVLCAGAAVFLGVHAVAPPPPRTAGVWTAASDLGSGHVLVRSDLMRVAWPPDAVPARVAGPGELVGRTLAAPVPRGAPLFATSVLGPALAGTDPARVAVPVRVSDPDVAALLHVGDHVDVLASDPDHPHVAATVAADAVVLALPRSPEHPGSDALPGRLAVLDVTHEAVENLVTAGVSSFITVTWSR